MDETLELRAVNARLRALLEDHGIDPDPAPPEPPQFGPPTEFEWRMQQVFAKSLAHLANKALERNALMDLLDKKQWPTGIAGAVRIRLPASFNVMRPSKPSP